MTNSAPKMSDKVERHGSPNNSVKRQNNRSASIRTTTYFSSASSATKASVTNNGSNGKASVTNGNTSVVGNVVVNTTRNTNGGRVACASPCVARNARNSPSRSADQSPRGSPTGGFYAGAKFSEPPSPASLPKPPSHWTTRLMTSCKQSETCCNISNHLKMILNVRAS